MDELDDEASLEPRLTKTFLGRRPSKTGVEISIGILLFTLMVSLTHWNEVEPIHELLSASGANVFGDGQIWRLWTTTFVHGDFGHFLSNAYMLGILGFLTAGYYGFRVYPLMAILLSGLVNALALLTYPARVHLVGASGMVYLLGGFWLTLYLLIERRYLLRHRLVRVLGIGLMIFFPTVYDPSTSYRTHALGILLGIAFGFAYFFKNKDRLRSYEVYSL